jgi:hypothetical protein
VLLDTSIRHPRRAHTAIFSCAFSVEAVRLGDASRFMVAPNQMYSLGVSQFQTNKKGNRFDAEETAIDIVA